MTSVKPVLKALFLISALSLFAVAAVPAADDPHAGHHPSQAITETPAVAPGKKDTMSDSEMMSNMHKMRDQMAMLQKTTDAKERSRLLDEHMQTMQDTMEMMRKRGGCMMGMGGMGGGDKTMSKPSHDGAKGEGADMMQMMMEQMMQHQKAMSGAGH